MHVCAHVDLMRVAQSRNRRQQRRTHARNGECDQAHPCRTFKQVQLKRCRYEGPNDFRRKTPMQKHQPAPSLVQERVTRRPKSRRKAVDHACRSLHERGRQLQLGCTHAEYVQLPQARQLDALATRLRSQSVPFTETGRGSPALDHIALQGAARGCASGFTDHYLLPVSTDRGSRGRTRRHSR